MLGYVVHRGGCRVTGRTGRRLVARTSAQMAEVGQVLEEAFRSFGL